MEKEIKSKTGLDVKTLEESRKQRANQAKERKKEHERRLQEDSRYLEAFLEDTEIENQAVDITKRIETVYVKFGWEEELPNNLIEIVNKAHTDAQKTKREFGFVTESGYWQPCHRHKPLLTDHAYWVLRDRPQQFLEGLEYDGLYKISYEEALAEIRKEKEDITVGPSQVLGLMLFALSKAETPWEVVKMTASIPLSFIYSTVVYPLLPDSTKAKKLMGTNNEIVEAHFQYFKDEMKGIFQLYEGQRT